MSERRSLSCLESWKVGRKHFFVVSVKNSPDASGPAVVVFCDWAARSCGLVSKKMNEKLETEK
jgi:hypothetical protein